MLFIQKTDGKVKSKEEKNVQKEKQICTKSITMENRGHLTLRFTISIKSNVLWTVCPIQFLKQNISYYVSVLKVTFLLLFVDWLHYLTLKSPRGF